MLFSIVTIIVFVMFLVLRKYLQSLFGSSNEFPDNTPLESFRKTNKLVMAHIINLYVLKKFNSKFTLLFVNLSSIK